MDFDYIKILVTVVLAMLGWLIAHYLTIQRTVAAKRREISLEHLINAYRILASEIAHRDLDTDRQVKFENILTDIQLFGTAGQVEQAKSLACIAASEGVFELDPILNNLRNDLREQLQLEAISGNVQWFRYADSDNKFPND